jgi:hypothetical protein
MKKVLKIPGRHAKRTVLIVGEGFSEVAFLEHLKSLYAERGSGISIKIGNARGKGPEHVLESAIRQSNNGAYDAIAALLDTDIPWTNALRAKASRKKILLLPSTPCLEGLLLEILGEPSVGTSDNLKRSFHPKLSGNSTDKQSYKKLFTKPLLDINRERVTTLDKLLCLMQDLK